MTLNSGTIYDINLTHIVSAILLSNYPVKSKESSCLTFLNKLNIFITELGGTYFDYNDIMETYNNLKTKFIKKFSGKNISTFNDWFLKRLDRIYPKNDEEDDALVSAIQQISS